TKFARLSYAPDRCGYLGGHVLRRVKKEHSMQTPNLDLNVNTLVSMILALQFAVFGWRINREIPLGDAGRKTWFPIPDIINIVSMFCVVALCIVVPLSKNHFNKAARVMLAVAFVFIAFHPVCMTAHYRLFSAKGRSIYLAHGKDYPYCTRAEAVCILIAVSVAAVVGWFVATYS
ncbi:MAG: hypothetical protein ACREA2_03725, partial [Blastocatellia bacterium]